MTTTHRCPDCDQFIYHDEDQLCPSCGRCEKHCHADNHKRMTRVPEVLHA